MPTTITRTQPSGDQNFRAECIRWFPEGTSAGFKTGDLVRLDTTAGQVLIATTTGATLAASTLLGQAMADASGSSTGTPTVPVYVFDQDTIMRFPVVSGSSSASTAITDLGVAYGIRHTATTDVCAANAWAVDKNETSAVYGIVESVPVGVGLGGAYPVGEQFGNVDYRFNLNKVQGAGVKP